jgi:hypothetical protein
MALAASGAVLGAASCSVDDDISAMPARPAQELVDSVGMNVHFHFLQSAYANTDRVVAAIADLGVRHVRDRILQLGATRRGFTALGDEHVTVQGICGTLGDRETMAELMTEVVTTYDDPIALFAAFEGINEPNRQGVPWMAETRAKTRELYLQRNAMGLARIPIASPALARVVPHAPQGMVRRQAQQLGDLSRYVDLGNIHVYPRMQTPGLGIAQAVSYQRLVTGDRPIICSEAGYFSAMNYQGGAFPTPSDVCAIYLPRLIMENWVRGIRRVYIYELLDDYDPTESDRKGSFGLLQVTGPGPSAPWSPKPQYHALKNFFRILEDPGHGQVQPASLPVSVSGPSDLETSLVAKRDGSRWLLLWRRARCYDPVRRERVACEPRMVRIRFDRRRAVTVYRPTVSAAPVNSYDRAQGLRIAVGAELLIARVH